MGGHHAVPCHRPNAIMPSPGAHSWGIGSSAPSQAAPSHLSEVIGDLCAYIAGIATTPLHGAAP